MVDLIYCQFFEHAIDTPICRRLYEKNVLKSSKQQTDQNTNS